MTNEEILCKLRQDIRLRGLSPATEEEWGSEGVSAIL